FESVLKLKLLAYLKHNNFITPEQHGFLQGHSTCTNLIESMNDWTNCLDKSIETLVLYVDFAKAFDCVSVSKLIYKLKCIGITGIFLDIIFSMLSGRSQKVKMGKSFSKERTVQSGVPQGSVLGHILFVF